jgi:hypothetical protein
MADDNRRTSPYIRGKKYYKVGNRQQKLMFDSLLVKTAMLYIYNRDICFSAFKYEN